MENKYRTYKYIKNTSGLKKYDPGMTPIGVQGSDYSSFGPQVIKNTESPANPYQSLQTGTIASLVPQYIELGKNLSKTWSAVGASNVANTAATNAANQIAESVAAGTTAEANYAALGNLAKLGGESAKTAAAAKAASAASTAIAAPMALYGAYKTITDADTYGRAPISGDELLGSAGQYTAENGAYLIGNIDSQGVAKTLRDYNNLGMTNTVSSGMTFGAGAGTLIGSLFTPAGSVLGGLLGAGLGALGGAITGWINRGKAKRKMHQIQENFANATAGFNKQSYAEQADRNIKSNFYQSHYGADEGLDLFNGEPNAAIGGGETVVKTKKVNGKTRITDAETMPITPEHPWRLDNYYVKLDEGSKEDKSSSVGVAGNNYDPFTGVPYSLEAVFAAEKFNSNNPYTKAEGELELLGIFDRQSKYQIKNPNPYEDMKKYNCGKGLSKYDPGKPFTGYDALQASRFYNIAPAAILSAAAYKQYMDAKSRPVSDAPLAYVEDPSEQAAINRMGAVTNINPTLDEILNLRAMRNYSINNSHATSGQKMLLRSQANKDVLASIVDAYSKKYELDQLARLNQANAQANTSRGRSQRLENAIGNQYNWRARAAGKKDEAQNKYFTSMFAQLPPMFQNMHNDVWQRALMNLYEQEQDAKRQETITNIEKLVKEGIENKLKQNKQPAQTVSTGVNPFYKYSWFPTQSVPMLNYDKNWILGGK